VLSYSPFSVTIAKEIEKDGPDMWIMSCQSRQQCLLGVDERAFYYPKQYVIRSV